MTTVDLTAASIALERADGASFERFAQAFLSASLGRNFVPLGGFKDGGADGFVAAEGTPAQHFMQASIEANSTSKIRRTVQRLREVGRDVKRLTYLTNQTIRMVDKEEEALSEELGVIIRIRDRKYICDHLNESAQSVTAFNTHLAQHLQFLANIGGATIIAAKSPIAARALCVFLGQELERRQGNRSLLEAVVDALVLWALEGTDPDKQIFLTRDAILERIETALPSAHQFIRSELDRRLGLLTKKWNSTGREINWHRDKGYCLPYTTREIVRKENIEDEILRQRVTELFQTRVEEQEDGRDQGFSTLVASLCHKTLELTFYRQGIEFAGFIKGSLEAEEIAPSIQDNLHNCIEEAKIGASDAPLVEEAALRVLRKTFYESDVVEREYLGKLSRTYFLMFSLQNEPRIVEYFQSMAADLNLYVGADLIVRALSERYLAKEDQAMRTCFEVLAAAGAKLILTEKALEEVLSHIQASDFQFRNHYANIEPYVDLAYASQSDRILIRAYFYAKLDKISRVRRPAGWRSYVEQFCSYNQLHRPAGIDSLRISLCEEFGFDYESTDEMEKSVDKQEVESLAREIEKLRSQKTKSELLAYNDALQVLRIYARRENGGEHGRGNPFGFRSWWLTKETAVLSAAGPIIAKKRAQFWMRPEFVLNYIALAPSKQKIMESYQTVFPSLLGVRLSNRLRPEVVAEYEARIREAAALSEARARAVVVELSDRLKSDRLKRYLHNLDSPPIPRQ